MIRNKTNMSAQRFLINQAIANSIIAAFQHAPIYVKGLKTDDPKRDNLRKELTKRLRSLGANYAKGRVKKDHFQIIINLAEKLTEKFKQTQTLRDDRFRIGIAQKSLNLYLKYLWCLGIIRQPPPHCPLDGIIISKLDLIRGEIGKYKWTKLDDIETYRTLINKCKCKAGTTSIAEWELREWNSNH
ncbi:MAG: hypothetical protein WCH84_06125 [Verrucomicrobiota bacterium]